MPQNSLKIAIGFNPAVPPSAAAAMVELKILNKSNVFEYFDGASTIDAGKCDDATESGATAIYEAVERAASIWRVQTLSDDELCGILKSAALNSSTVNKPILLMTLDQIGERGLERCRDDLTTLALSDEPEIALRAVGTIGITGSADDFGTLGKLTLSEMPQMPWVATHAIADIGGTGSVKALEIIAGQAETVELRHEAAKLADKERQRRR